MVRKARRATGARAFGFNYFFPPPNQKGREHDHAEEGQEEVYFVVRGSGRMLVGGEEVELKPGRFVRVDPDATRVPVAGPSWRRAGSRSSSAASSSSACSSGPATGAWRIWSVSRCSSPSSRPRGHF